MTRSLRPLFWLAPTLALAVALPLAAQQITVKTVAGGGPNNIPATAANLNYPVSGATDAAGDYLFADAQHVFRVDAKGVITIVAG